MYPYGASWSDYDPAPERAPSVSLYVTLLDRYREWRERRFPFAPSERVWTISIAWRRHWRVIAGLVALVVVMAIATTVALRLATAAPGRTPRLSLGASATSQPATGVIVHPPTGQGSATPGPLTYTAGVWLSDTSPPASGVVQVFVRVSNEGAPVPGCVTSVYVSYPGGGGQSLGVTRTDAYGLATFNLALNNASTTRPITIKASAVVPTGSADATITFIARPAGGAVVTPSPSTKP